MSLTSPALASVSASFFIIIFFFYRNSDFYLIVGRVQLLVSVFLCTSKIEHLMTVMQQLRTPLISGFIFLFPFPTLSEKLRLSFSFLFSYFYR
jgi:hypothetical protein